MSTLLWILGTTFTVSLMAWTGLLFIQLKEEYLQKILLPLVSFSAGTLLGGGLLHLLPQSIKTMGDMDIVFLWVLVGFSVFFVLEQFIEWHHCHRVPSEHNKSSLSYLVLVSDFVHKFIGGLSIAGAFLVNFEVGIAAWIAAAAHELPQEFGQFGILIHGGWKKYKALLINFLVGLSLVFGGIVAYLASGLINVDFLLPFASGIFIYIAASDIIPEIKYKNTESCDTDKKNLKKHFLHFFTFLVGIILMLLIKKLV